MIRGAYSGDDVRFLNGFYDSTQQRYPRAWGMAGRPGQEGYVKGAGRIYSQVRVRAGFCALLCWTTLCRNDDAARLTLIEAALVVSVAAAARPPGARPLHPAPLFVPARE